MIVDVLSFSTAVEIAASRGVQVFPFQQRRAAAADFSAAHLALLASPYREVGFSLPASSLRTIPAGTVLVLPSPNGSTLSLGRGGVPTYAGCPRNATAVVHAAARHGPPVTVLTAGERWPDGGLRSGLEDWLGAGAIIRRLPGSRSAEARVAAAAFEAGRDQLWDLLARCGSGRELIERGSAGDVALAAEWAVSLTVPLLLASAYDHDPASASGALAPQPIGQASPGG